MAYSRRWQVGSIGMARAVDGPIDPGDGELAGGTPRPASDGWFGVGTEHGREQFSEAE